MLCKLSHLHSTMYLISQLLHKKPSPNGKIMTFQKGHNAEIASLISTTGQKTVEHTWVRLNTGSAVRPALLGVRTCFFGKKKPAVCILVLERNNLLQCRNPRAPERRGKRDQGVLQTFMCHRQCCSETDRFGRACYFLSSARGILNMLCLDNSMVSVSSSS